MRAITAVVLATFLAIVVLGSVAVAILCFNAKFQVEQEKQNQAASYETRLKWANEQSQKMQMESANLKKALQVANDSLMEANRANIALRTPVTSGEIANQLDSLRTEIASLRASNQVLNVHIKTLENYIQDHNSARTPAPPSRIR